MSAKQFNVFWLRMSLLRDGRVLSDELVKALAGLLEGERVLGRDVGQEMDERFRRQIGQATGEGLEGRV